MAETTTTEGAPTGQHVRLGWALVLISIAQLMVVLDATIANIAAGARNIATKLEARVRLRNTRNGSSGCSTRLSITMNVASRRAPTIRLVTVHVLLQPC